MPESNPGPADFMEWLRKVWSPETYGLNPAGPGTGPFSGMPGVPSWFAPTADPREVERRIADLQVVSQWLRTNLSMLEMTIRTLEMQKSALEGLASASGAARPTE
ncbi:MAG: PhaM family polyhydroxyalkanoate granule multifunctional regulatory protein [Pseudomonadota bacterium]